MLLQGKKIVLIGGSSGMGLSAAEAFVRAGAQVLAVGLPDSVEAAQARLAGGQALVLPGNATEPDCASNAIERCMAEFGGFDGLYHVAGGSGRRRGDGPLHEMTPEGWQYTLDLNLTAVMLSNQAAVRQFLRMKQGGSILNMGSVLGAYPAPDFFATHAYAAAKAALSGFCRSIAAYYAKDNIRINVIAPGLVDTPMARRAAEDAETMAFVQKKQALEGGRIGAANDLDGLALYFMSDQSAFTTGQTIYVDGGWSVL